MKITYYVAMSTDGFIAREDGDVSWLDDLDIDVGETGYDEFFADIDGLVMGRNTYDFIFNYGSWPYGDKPGWVFTTRDLKPLPGANIKIVQATDELIREAESQNLKHLWLVGGGKLASLFLEKKLLTHLSIFVMPVTLNEGIPLFANHKLEKIFNEQTKIYHKKGFTQIEIEL